MAKQPSKTPQVMRMLHGYDLPSQEFPDDEGVRQSFNFAPGYHGLVYRANRPGGSEEAAEAAGQDHSEEHGKEQTGHDQVEADAEEAKAAKTTVQYKLQSMKWGLIPFWTKRNPDYGSMMKTINCRDDSLYEDRGMWTTMKRKKRCIVVAQGFYEWLKKNNGREKIPHFVKRKDGELMLFAGLWDSVKYEDSDETLYTYTIITTDVNKQLAFLHDRMPVIFDNSDTDAIRTWLDPQQTEWSNMLQSLLKPYGEELEVYPVNKEVGKVGNNSPSFIVPLDSKENKNNIKNFFGNQQKMVQGKVTKAKVADGSDGTSQDDTDTRKTVDDNSTEDNAPKPVGLIDESSTAGNKRNRENDEEDSAQTRDLEASSKRVTPKPAKKMRSATSNGNATKSPSKPAAAGSQKITAFFGK